MVTSLGAAVLILGITVFLKEEIKCSCRHLDLESVPACLHFNFVPLSKPHNLPESVSFFIE